MTQRFRFAAALMIACSAFPAQQTLVDVQSVPATGDPLSAVVHFDVPAPANLTPIDCDLLIAGAGMGGVAAAIASSSRGHTVCLIEETDWVGGQMTAGGVSALDENRFIEISGGTRTYYEFRNRLRQYYRERYHLSPEAAKLENFNPGSCYVSPLCVEPKAGVEVLTAMLKRPGIRVFLRTAVFHLERSGGRVMSALAWRFDGKQVLKFTPKWVLDATETGDLLPLARVPYVVGSEAKAETREPHAAAQANPACVQSFTYPFVVERGDGAAGAHEIAEPFGYEAIRKRQNFTLRVNYPVENGWKGFVQYGMYGEDPPIPNNMSPGPFFMWRRLLAAKNFTGTDVPRDLALINWPRQDYAAESILDRTPEDAARILQRAKQTSMAFLYWLQHDQHHPELTLRPDIMGTADGLSKYPYIRESRRLKARGRVLEQDIGDEFQPGPRAKWFRDSIGTAFYMIDIHPCSANERGRMMMPRPFQIPMSALEPRELVNFLAAGKNLGVTHLTNGAFRLHPVEWNIGEAAATMASIAIEGTGGDVQTALAKAGVPLVWFDDLPVTDPDFAAIHVAAIRGWYPLGADLHASPDAPLTRAEAARAIAAYKGHEVGRDAAIKLAVQQGWMAVDHRNWFHPDLPLYWTDVRETNLHLTGFEMTHTGPVKRREWARRLAGGLGGIW
jgi:hypothetical protein